ncbi:MAG: asparagine synthase (glutamine-hydrolyzing) [Eggerthellaceae bacterium]|nr:asparagine synthase (glutamine-hydrolyzing) [Eggerthellaceae bacterium]
MCGICGFMGDFEANDKKSLSVLKKMCDVMAHRGPDGEGQYVDEGIALGHRRLSLIDLEGGNQPMVRATGEKASAITSPALRADGTPCMTKTLSKKHGRYAIVFNGEIYNYRDLRVDLENDGWKFETQSDTETLLVGYLAWGQGVLDKIRGMFAFAIWDAEKKELFCARDFFGIKPFYYTVIKDEDKPSAFIFASEIKSILEHPSYDRKLNTEALDQYLCFQFSALPETFFKGIFKLEPGHCCVVRTDGSMTMRRYWRPEYRFNENRDMDKTVEAIHDAIRESVRYHNVADVEVGSFLSSGIDSSYMAACLAKENPDIETFTVGFSEYGNSKEARDEISWARELAQDLGIKNDSKHITEEEYWKVLPRVQWHMDEPSADPSAVALYFVDMIAAKKVKAVLSGEGADEFFGGYRIYQTPLANAKVGWVPKPLLKGAASFMKKHNLRGENYLTRASQSVEDWYYTNANAVAFDTKERNRIRGYAEELAQDIPTPQQITAPVYGEVSDLDETTRMQYVDLYFWLVGDILLKTDKMSMAHSLESRVPFMDKKVFALSCTIPTEQKITQSQTKIALRRAATRLIPLDWAEKEKLGFPVPVVGWLKQDRYYDLIKQWFTSDEAKLFCDINELVRLLDEHKESVRDNTRRIWIVYMFLMWYRIYFVDKSIPELPELD